MSRGTGRQLKERLNGRQLCERRDQIGVLVTKGIEALSEAEKLMQTVAPHGFYFDRNTMYGLGEDGRKLSIINNLVRQTDKKFWDKVIELGNFRALMSHKKRNEVSDYLENCPPLTYENLSDTFRGLLAGRAGLLHELVETSFLERDKTFKSNGGLKINKRQAFSKVFCKYGYSTTNDSRYRLEDVSKACCLLLGIKEVHIINLLQTKEPNEDVIVADAYRARRFKNGNVHLWVESVDLLAKLNDVLNKCFDGKLGEMA